MAVAYRSGSSANSSQGLSATATITIPSAVNVGDVMVAVFGGQANTSGTRSWSTPSGWTVGPTATSGQTDPGYTACAAVFLKVAVPADVTGSATVASTLTGANGNGTSGVLASYSGAKLTPDVTATNTGGSTTSTNPLTSSSVTTTGANEMVIECWNMETINGTSTALTTPATSRVSVQGAFNANKLAISDQLQASAGASGTSSATCATHGNWCALTLALVPVTLPSLRASSTATATGTSSVTLTIPAAVQVGDLMVASFMTYNSGFSTPSGWSAMPVNYSPQQQDGGTSRQWVFWKIATSGDTGGSATVSCSGGSIWSGAAMAAYANVNSVGPVHALGSLGSSGSVTSLASLPIDATVQGCLVLTIMAGAPSVGGALSSSCSGGATNDVELGSAGNGIVTIYEQSQSTVGLSAVQTLTLTASCQSSVFTMALLPVQTLASPSVVGTSSAINASSGAGSITLPASISAGNDIWLFVTDGASSAIYPSAPTGYSMVAQAWGAPDTTLSAVGPAVQLFHKSASGADAGASVSCPTNGSGQSMVCVVTATAGGADVTGTAASSSGGAQAITAAAVTPTTSPEMVLWFGGCLNAPTISGTLATLQQVQQAGGNAFDGLAMGQDAVTGTSSTPLFGGVANTSSKKLGLAVVTVAVKVAASSLPPLPVIVRQAVQRSAVR